jgi:hypothetical protein
MVGHRCAGALEAVAVGGEFWNLSHKRLLIQVRSAYERSCTNDYQMLTLRTGTKMTGYDFKLSREMEIAFRNTLSNPGPAFCVESVNVGSLMP